MKIIAAKSDNMESCRGVFPLWTRRAGFGVITIFKGPEKKLFIENDQILAGTTVYFTNTLNLNMVSHDGELVLL